MSDQILVAIFSLAGTLFGSGGGIFIANKLVNHRIESLEKRMANIPERVLVAEQSIQSAIQKQDEDRARSISMNNKLDQIHNDVIIFKHEMNKKDGGK